MVATCAPVLVVTETNARRLGLRSGAGRLGRVAAAPGFRKTPTGPVPAGPDSRIVQLLGCPSSGSTSADLISRVMVDLNVDGNAFMGSSAPAAR